jgi:hypothetical protein
LLFALPFFLCLALFFGNARIFLGNLACLFFFQCPDASFFFLLFANAFRY